MVRTLYKPGLPLEANIDTQKSYTTSSPSNPPSPLKGPGFSHASSPRASPFRRQTSSASNTSSGSANSPSGAAPTLRPTTPTNGHSSSTRPSTPSRLHTSLKPYEDATTFSPRFRSNGGSESPTKPHGHDTERQDAPASSYSPRATAHRASPQPQAPTPSQARVQPSSGSPYRASASASASSPHSPNYTPSASQKSNTNSSNNNAAANLDALSRLPAPLVRALRDAFALLDRDSTGTLTQADVAAMHTQLGLPPPTATELAAYFPPGAPTPVALPAFLGGLAGPLARMDSSADLLEALGAFDERESGAVGVQELLDAVCDGGGGGGGMGGTYGYGGIGNRLERSEVESKVLKGFTGRPRLGKAAPGAGGGEVFRYRDWVTNLGASGTGREGREGRAVEG